MRKTSWLAPLLGLVTLLLVGCSVTEGADGVDGKPAIDAIPPEATETASETPTVDPLRHAIVAAAFSPRSARVGDTVDLVVSVAGVQDLFGVQLHLSYDSAVLGVVDADAEEDGFQIGHGGMIAVEYVLANRADAGQQRIDYAVAQAVDADAVSGDGELARASFQTKRPGMAEVQLVSVILANSRGEAVPAIVPSAPVVLDVK